MFLLIRWIDASKEFFQQLGWWGVLLYAAIMIVVQLFLLPLAPLAIGAGVIFGMGGGFTAVTLGTGIGGAVNFLLSRHVARDAISHRLARNEKLRLIDAAIGREGWKILVPLRFCPLPFGLANYCYGLTAIPFGAYMLATIPTIIPANLFFCWLGASAQESMAALTGSGRPRHPFEYVMMVAGLLAGFFALAYAGKVAKAAVARGAAAETAPPPATPTAP